MFNTSPSWLVVFGLALNFVGALMIGIEAIGATEFLRALKEEKEVSKRFAEIGFISTINQTFVFIFVSIGTFLLSWGLVRELSVVESLLVAPFGFFFWKAAVRITEIVQDMVQSLAPPRWLHEKGVVFLLIALLWGLAWGIVFLVVSIAAILVRFGIDLPLRLFSEKVIGVCVMRILKNVDERVREMRRWYFKGTVFVGVIVLLTGFLYQLIGTILGVLENSGK